LWDSTNFNPTITFTSSSGAGQIHWLVTDHLGTPRMILDQTGSLVNVKHHDYLPFGEEVFANTGLRTSTLGYSGGDGVRQQFTQKERDVETGLDFFEARYFSSAQGKFTSTDPYDINFITDNQQAVIEIFADRFGNASCAFL
jgi:RHS repeat-associated protein